MTELEQLAYLGLPCPLCGADPGTWCVTAHPYRHPPGRRSVYLHQSRTALLWEAWGLGRTSGVLMVYASVAQRLEGALRGEAWARDMPTDPQGILRWLRAQETRARV